MSQPHHLFATCPKGIEPLLAEELQALGADAPRVARGGVAFDGDLELAYRACLWSRLANRVLLPVARFSAATPEALYDGVRSVAWAEHLAPDGTLAVDYTAIQSRVEHTHFGALKVKDAIVDQLRDQFGQRPSIDVARPHVRVNVHVQRDEATVSIDLSGESLHRRGYREEGGVAPLKENLAAAILMRAGWPAIAAEGGSLVDPMCGSGTLVVEGALMAGRIAPGISREYFGFQRWRKHDARLWERLLQEAERLRVEHGNAIPTIVGYDIDRNAVRVALVNVERAGLQGKVHIERRELAQCQAPRSARPGLLVVNPPYGERLGTQPELIRLYRELGSVLRERFEGWKAAVFTGNPDLGKRMGIRAKRMHTLFNGPIECRLLHFEVAPAWYVSGAIRLSESGEMFANRLRKNQRHLGKWTRRDGITCYRVYDADLPEYALAVDLYQARPVAHPEREELHAHVQEYEAPRSVDAEKARKRLEEALRAIASVFEIPEEQIHLKVRRRQKGKAQYEKIEAAGVFHEVTEDGLRFLVNFTDYLDTGIFLDHRITRGLVRELAAGRRFLNLFAYTGTATVYAAAGGASSTMTVDMSKTYLDWAGRNLALNGFRGRTHRVVQADCLVWLEEAARTAAKDAGGKYGLIFLDPPTFSTSKRMQGTFDVQRDHVALIRNAAALLADDGVLIFSNNFRGFRLDREALGELLVEDISQATIPPDFERNRRIHNCWKITRSPRRSE